MFSIVCILEKKSDVNVASYLLLFSLASHMAFFDVPVAEEVSEVAKDGEDAIAHVGEYSDQ